jgi:hypothetical protein
MMPLSGDYLGSPCEVKSMDNALILAGYITGISGEGLEISDKNDTLPIIHCNTTVKVSILSETLGLRVVIGKVYLSTKDFTRIVDVQNAADYEKRSFFRVRLSIQSSAGLLPENTEETGGAENGPKTGDTEPVEFFPILIRDLSLSGLFFTTDRKLRPDNRVVIRLDISGSDLTLVCKVIRSISVEMDTKDGYGCEFQNNTGRQFDLLCKYLFDCQREQLRLLREMQGSHP